MAAYLASAIQQVSITIAASATSNTATITGVGSGAFILLQGYTTTDTSTTASSLPRIELTNSTTVTAFRGTSSTATVTVNAVIIDGDTTNLIKSVQKGTISFTTAQTTNTATISAVTNANAVVHFLGATSTAASPNLEVNACFLSLSGTTVTATKLSAGSAQTIGWIVIEFQGSVLNQAIQNIAQSGTQSTTTTNTTITSVNRSNSFIICAGQSAVDTSNEATMYQNAQLSSATNVLVTRNTAPFVNAVWQGSVVEFNAGVLNQAVQRNTIALSAATSKTSTITSVSTSNGFVNFLGNTTTATTFDPATANHKITLTNATTVTETINTAATGTGSFEVIEFSPTVPVLGTNSAFLVFM